MRRKKARLISKEKVGGITLCYRISKNTLYPTRKELAFQPTAALKAGPTQSSLVRNMLM
jgi:hypothetical protein